MTISLSEKTQQLLEQQMKSGGFASHDEAVHAALQALDELRGVAIEDLDDDTQAALDQAFKQSERGEGEPWQEFRAKFEKKHFGAK